MLEKILKFKVYFLMLPIVLLAIIVVYSVTKKKNEEVIYEPIVEEIQKIEEKNTAVEEKQTIKVDIKGEVNTPGVYELEIGKRVDDAIKLSGGLTENADTTLLNLSKNLKDEMIIIVYNKYEIEKLKNELTTTKTVIEYIEKECSCPDTINDACIKEPITNNSNKKESQNTNTTTNESSLEQTSGLVNINTATKEELMTVSGIGETKADAIIKYRKEVGLFKDISEITNVSGIGESTFEKIKNNITI